MVLWYRRTYVSDASNELLRAKIEILPLWEVFVNLNDIRNLHTAPNAIKGGVQIIKMEI